MPLRNALCRGGVHELLQTALPTELKVQPSLFSVFSLSAPPLPSLPLNAVSSQRVRESVTIFRKNTYLCQAARMKIAEKRRRPAEEVMPMAIDGFLCFFSQMKQTPPQKKKKKKRRRMRETGAKQHFGLF